MKIIILPVILFIFGSAQVIAQTQPLLKIGNENISKTAFLKAYQKNKSDSVTTEKDIKDYLELFIRFKLKVRSAFQSGLDSLPTQKAELAEFRSQLAELYLIDDDSFEKLVQEASDRRKKDIHLAHIFIPFGGAGNKDTAFADRQARVARNLLANGSDFAKVAADFSADSITSKRAGNMGFITVFTLPYFFENIAYSLPPGQISAPVKSNLGYHIFKNLGERKAVGRVRIAQILLAFEPGADTATLSTIRLRGDSIYTALLKGASFSDMVSRYTDDNTSFAAHGELPAFGVGVYDLLFEDAAFSLPSDGAITKPIKTAFGFHILKRLERIPAMKEYTDDSTLGSLKELVKRDDRMEVSRKALLKKVYALTKLHNLPFNQSSFTTISDSSLRNKNYVPKGAINRKTPLFTIDGINVLMQDWLKYLLDVSTIAAMSQGQGLMKLYQQFQDSYAIEYYRAHLENYNAEFAAQLKEFKEGNLLFEMMQRMVWDKAARDSTGLRKFYNSHESHYSWQPSADAIIFSAVDSASAFDVRKKLAKGIIGWRNILLSYLDKVQADSGRYELNQLPMALPTGSNEPLTNPVKNSGSSNMYTFTLVIKRYPGNLRKNFEDAKGAVLNDYQKYLEENWIADLKKRYPVTVNKALLNSLW